MVTCRECGYRNEGRKTCKRCGASLDAKTPDDADLADLPDITRYEINKELKKMLKHFTPMEPQFNEYEYCNQKLDFFSKWGYVPTAIPFVGIFFIGSMILLSVFTVFKVSLKLYNGLLLWYAMYFALGIYCIVAFYKSLKENRKNIRKYLGREVELAKQLTNAVNDYGPMIIDEKYTDPRILERLMIINRSGRTDTLEQAIDMLYHESGKTKEEAQKYLDKLVSRQTEFGETNAKVFCSANFFGLYHKDQEPLKK
jgi:hypothetical protein